MTGRPAKTKKKRIIDLLSGLYPGASTELIFASTFQLLVAVMLSAQCTDRQVNKVTGRLFQKYSVPEDFARLEEEELAGEIKGVGLYRNKSRNIVRTSRLLVENHNSRVPQSRVDLEALPGVGRKTANVVLNVAYSAPVMPVDTHVFRVSRRLGLSAGKTPGAVEKDLTALIPAELMGAMHHSLILHGRRICRARSPLCGDCPLADLCPGKA